MRRRWLVLLLMGVGAAVYGGIALATPSAGLVNILLARGTDASEGSLPIQMGTDVVMTQITVDPGGSSGWHSHPGGAIIVVKQGSPTLYRAIGSQCQTTTYGPGDAFIERPGEVDDVLNASTAPYVLYVTFPRVPPGGNPRIDEPDPGTCPWSLTSRRARRSQRRGRRAPPHPTRGRGERHHCPLGRDHPATCPCVPGDGPAPVRRRLHHVDRRRRGRRRDRRGSAAG